MSKEKKKILIFIACSILSTFIIIFFSFRMNSTFSSIPENCTIFLKSSMTRLSSYELAMGEDEWVPYNGKRVTSSLNYSYAKIQIVNDTKESLSLCFMNKAHNDFTTLLAVKNNFAELSELFGDHFPFFHTAIPNSKAIFELSVPADVSTKTYIVEYSSSFFNIFDPIIIKSDMCESIVYRENTFMSIFFSLLLIFLCLFILELILTRRKIFLSCCFFILTEIFLVLYETRYLLVLLKLPYANWLLPILMVCNLIAIIAFFFIVAGIENQKLLIAKKITYLCLILVGAISFFVNSSFIITILSVFYFILFILMCIVLNNPITTGNKCLIYILIGLIPYFSIKLMGMFSTLIEVRFPFLTDFSFIMGLYVSTLILYLVSRCYLPKLYKIEDEEKKKDIIESWQIYDKFIQPLNIIQSSAQMIQTNVSEARVFVAGEIIEEKVNYIKEILGKTDSFKRKKQLKESRNVDKRLKSMEKFITDAIGTVKICIFNFEGQIAEDIEVLLQFEGFSCVKLNSVYEVLGSIDKKAIDILFVDPSTNSKVAFSLCSIIREKYSMLEFPIIGIVDYYATYLIHKGFMVGINDFISKPFDSSELIARMYPHLKLNKVSSEVLKLSQSDQEKNTYLYFITHNINSPLTLLLNQLQELCSICTDPDKLNILADLKLSANEINEIIQNFLIFFRLMDGRCINRKQSFVPDDILVTVKGIAELKASSNKQKIIWEIPKKLPYITFDESAFKGIITNLLDNAIKYSPRFSTITFKIEIINNLDNDFYKISVIDAGPGIPQEYQDRLFVRYANRGTVKHKPEESVGLGLFVTNELAKMNNSILKYEDAIGGGACFVLTIPIDLRSYDEN